MLLQADHPFNNAGPDNMCAITTDFYTRPLVIQGAVSRSPSASYRSGEAVLTRLVCGQGAGGDVTATGVLADVLRCGTQQPSL